MNTSKKAGGAVAAALVALAFPSAAFADPNTPAAAGVLSGKTVFLDPGHQAANNPAQLNRQVPDGRGKTKACETGGMTTVTGVPEHTITWQVAQLVKQRLEQAGARVLLSRQDDTGWGGCINERAEAANNAHADVAVNIHADSSSKGSDEAHKGFHIIVPTLPLPDAEANKVQAWEGRKAAYVMRDALIAAGLPVSNYIQTQNGISVRPDIAGVNLAHVPDYLVEMGNGSNPQEAQELTSPQGQQRYAGALTDGLTRYLTGQEPAKATANQQAARPASLLADSGSTATRGGFDVEFLKQDPAPVPPVDPAAPADPSNPIGYVPGQPGGYVDPSIPGVPLTAPVGASPDWTPSIPGGASSLGSYGGVANAASIASLIPQIQGYVQKGDVGGLATLIAQQAGSLVSSQSSTIGTGVGTVGSQIQNALPMLNTIIPGLSNILPQAQALAAAQLAQRTPAAAGSAGTATRGGFDVDFLKQDPAPVYPDPSSGSQPPAAGAPPVAQPAAPSYPGTTGYPGVNDPQAGYVDPSLPGVPLTPPPGASPDWTPSVGGAGGLGSYGGGADATSIATLIPQVQGYVQKGDVSGLATLIAQQAGSLLSSQSGTIGTSVATVGSQIQSALPMLNTIVPGLTNILPQAQAAAVVQLQQQQAAKAAPVPPAAPAPPVAPAS